MKVTNYGKVEDPNASTRVTYAGIAAQWRDVPQTVVNNGRIELNNPKPLRCWVNGREQQAYQTRIWMGGVEQPSLDEYAPREKLKYAVTR